MKRIISIFIGLVLVLTGCGNTALKPNQIQYEGKVLTYGTTQVDDIFFEDGIDLVINKSNEVRCITITNDDVITYNDISKIIAQKRGLTYNDISVGDKVSKVESKYSHEIGYDGLISVFLNGSKEIESTSQSRSDETMCITYIYDEDEITKIMICDNVYGMKMK